LLCEAWKVSADVLWGKEKRALTLRLSSEQGLVSHYPDKGVYVTREEQFLVDRFAELKTPWALERKSEVVDLGGKGVLVPEFVLRHKTDGRVAYVEVMGFWKREYLEARLALLRSDGPKNLVLAVPWRLRGNDDELADAPGEVLFFKDVIVAKELLERAERVAKK
jgi:predicted nuclease of restriction endonuclease-like RecB superfamily